MDKSASRIRRFKSAGQAQRLLTVYGVVGNLFRQGRYLTRAIRYREFRLRGQSINDSLRTLRLLTDFQTIEFLDQTQLATVW